MTTPAEPVTETAVQWLTTPARCAGSASGWLYTEQLGARIAEFYVEEPGGLFGLHRAMPDVIPPAAIVSAWRRQFPAFGLMMKEAEKLRAELLLEQALVIADTGEGSVPRLALQVSVRQAMAAQLDAGRYGKGAGTQGGVSGLLATDPQPVALDVDDATLASIAMQGQHAPTD